ncbi:hypothetical protein CSR02_09670 [Acetobacter pomorum]|uniref:DUF2155 domain-containing protein n=1 Tax=Acetobacter pomorum TaxID=65959 RepID=A0A2G4RDG0_9PROT|nr:DUF2155 domain-containing protein [Acetobacter pomorum]PHY93765.1 hypothetical protein CSR02_09670 [Acetobacter pomorum]
MKRYALAVCAATLAGMPLLAHAAGTVLAPPAVYAPDTWQGKDTAVVRVLDRLDAHVEVLSIPVGTTAHYKSLDITPSRCLLRPPTLSPDAAAWLAMQDKHPNGATFQGWMLAAEPALGVFESPVYDVRMVRCEGADTGPALPPLPKPVAPPAPPASGVDTAPTPADGGDKTSSGHTGSSEVPDTLPDKQETGGVY